MLAEHEFPKGLDHFEKAVFDGANQFVVGIMAGRGKRARHPHGLDLEAAMKDAESNPRAVLYACAPSGRHCVLDRKRWPEWRARRAANLAKAS